MVVGSRWAVYGGSPLFGDVDERFALVATTNAAPRICRCIGIANTSAAGAAGAGHCRCTWPPTALQGAARAVCITPGTIYRLRIHEQFLIPVHRAHRKKSCISVFPRPAAWQLIAARATCFASTSGLGFGEA